MRFAAPLALTLILAACGTPQERCIRSATQEARILDRLIAETEANLARGYAFESREVVRHVWTVCDDHIRRDRHRVRPMCFEPEVRTVKRPLAIDPQVEARKLDGLKERRAALARRATGDIARCRAQFPEG
ncbi:MAG: hypothetical protein WBB85_01365 [Albidovulum sp.]|uniref:hypothetical protein n=1 Tax=Albidovulum sp. TaxID=1872424 RepID=UPI003C8E45A3